MNVARVLSRGSYKPAKHLYLLQDRLKRIVSGQDRRLEIKMPVRHSKSHTINIWFALQYLLAFPDRKVLLITGTSGLAEGFSAIVRDLYHELAPRLVGRQVHYSQKAANYWIIADMNGKRTGGSYQACGLKSQISGYGTNLLLLDDLTKDDEDAASPTMRDKAWSRIGSTIETRLAPGAPIVSIGTPWSEDDHFARFQAAEEAGGFPWSRIRLPALSEGEGDALGRPEGEALWPEMWPASLLQDIKRNYEAKGQMHFWEALYQCAPLPGGGLSEWPAEYFTDILNDHVIDEQQVAFRVLSLDPSKGVKKKSGCFSAWCDVTMTRNGHLYVRPTLLVLPTAAVEDNTVGMVRSALEEGKPFTSIICEGNGMQDVIARNILTKCRTASLPCPIFTVVNTEQKESRVRASLTPLLAQHRIHVMPAPHSKLFIQQLRLFPNGDKVDGPDSLELATQILNWLISGCKAGKIQAAS